MTSGLKINTMILCLVYRNRSDAIFYIFNPLIRVLEFWGVPHSYTQSAKLLASEKTSDVETIALLITITIKILLHVSSAEEKSLKYANLFVLKIITRNFPKRQKHKINFKWRQKCFHVVLAEVFGESITMFVHIPFNSARFD